MATLNKTILEEALVSSRISKDTYHQERQVNTMNRLLRLVSRQKTIDSFSLSKNAGLNHCTTLIYCRWLAENGFVIIEHQGQGGVCWYSIP